jgi:putative intracellular protease/amidase
MDEIARRTGGCLDGRRVAVLIESDYFEPEIHYYQRRFAEEGAEVHFLTRLWGQPSLTFTGHEWRAPFHAHRSVEGVDEDTLRSYAALVVPSGMVADRLRYTEDPTRLPPATALVRRAFGLPDLVVGIICHGLCWWPRCRSWSAAAGSPATTTCSATSATWARSTSTRTSWWTAPWSPGGPASTPTSSPGR